MREEARELRRTRQLTIDEIAERLAVSRTTVFFWVGDMPRPERCVENAKPPLYRLGNDAMRAKYRQLREMAYREGMDSFDRLQERTGFLEFVTLFIAEGYKRSRNVVSIANSDPAIVLFSADGVLTVATNDTYFRARLQAWVDCLRQRWLDSPAVGA
jgi:DNA-binding IclR family transcriptional regulator